MKHKLLSLLVVSVSVTAFADDTGFKLNLNRMMGSVKCSVTNAKTDHPEVNCDLKVKGNKNLAIDMKQTKKSGFYGMDTFVEGERSRSFVLTADAHKVVNSFSFADVTKSKNQATVNVAGGATSSVGAVSLSPLTFLSSADESELTISATFAFYGQDKATVRDMQNGIVPDELMNQIQPQLDQFLSNYTK